MPTESMNHICLNSKYSTTRMFNKKIVNSNSIMPYQNYGGLQIKGLYKNSFTNMPLISIITPVYNGGKFIRETIESIINQSYSNVEYIIIDGNSNDNTLSIIKEYDEQVDLWISEPDHGMYDAINKGFQLARGDIIAWLNADDLYLPGSLNIVANVFLKDENIQWLTGINSHIDEDSNLINVSCPKYYFKSFISKGYYRGDLLGFIQQESTFFRKSLLQKTNISKDLKLAADYDLWIKFSHHAKLYTIKTILSSFRIHTGQQSEQIDEYYKECTSVSSNLKIKFLKYLLIPFSIFLGQKAIKPINFLRNK